MPSPSNHRLASAETVLRECFWGDYKLSAQDLLHRLDVGDPGFERFLFSKIIENSSHPSRHLRTLFAPRIMNELLQRHLTQSGNKPRVRLVAANLTDKHNLVPELQWNR
ncbi:hypothetical protein C6366_14075 [Desulfonatronum sp. SC1]|nr:hypothetical protein C6366_14075 [Desulfonatronum sp. SC1]